MELKVLCDCGQKYAFDVEPIANQMPFRVNCPSCGKDGTSTANDLLAASPPVVAAPMNPSGPMRLSISHSAPPAPALTVEASPAAPPVLPQPIKAPGRNWEKADMTETHSMALGFLGAMLGATVGVVLMFVFLKVVGITFPLMGTAIGALTGSGARLLYKGTDVTLGVMAGVIALFATGGTILLLFGLFAIMKLISVIVSVSIAYKIAG